LGGINIKIKVKRTIILGIVIYLLKLVLGEMDILRTTYIPSFYPNEANVIMICLRLFSGLFMGILAFNIQNYKNIKVLIWEVLLVYLFYNLLIIFFRSLTLLGINTSFFNFIAIDVPGIKIGHVFIFDFFLDVFLLFAGMLFRAVLQHIKNLLVRALRRAVSLKEG